MMLMMTFGCKPKEKESLNNQITWSLISDSLSYTDPEMAADEDSLGLGEPAFNVRADILIPSSKDRTLSHLIDSIRHQIIYRIIDVNAPNDAPEMMIKQHLQSLLTEYKASVEEGKKMMDEHDVSDAGLSLFIMQSFTSDSMAYNDNNIISLVTRLEEYTGGAHGMSSLSALNYDLARNKRITFSMLFTPGSDEDINNIIQQELLKKYNVSSIEELESEGIYNCENARVAENFFLTDKGCRSI